MKCIGKVVSFIVIVLVQGFMANAGIVRWSTCCASNPPLRSPGRDGQRKLEVGGV